MSRSNPNNTLLNPSIRFFEWSGSEGKVSYYDKDLGETVLVDLPFSFMVLDQLATVTGYSSNDKCGIWSNEVRDTRHSVLTVKTKSGVIAKGLWADIRDTVKGQGGKYANSVYVAFYDEANTLQIGNFKMAGSANNSTSDKDKKRGWIEFTKANNVDEIAVKIAEAEADKNGGTKFFRPIFAATKVSDETNQIAIDLDKRLQTYLTAYLAQNDAIIESTSSGFDKVSDATLKAVLDLMMAKDVDESSFVMRFTDGKRDAVEFLFESEAKQLFENLKAL